MFPICLCQKFYFIFPILSVISARSNNIYHILYEILFGIHRHQPFNQCFVFFVFFIKLLLPSWCCKLSFLYLSSSLVFFMDFTFSIESSRLVRYVSYLSGHKVSVVSGLSPFASFFNDFNPGEN